MQPHPDALGVDGDGDRVMLRLGGLAVPLPWLQSFAPVLQPQVPSPGLGEETVPSLGADHVHSTLLRSPKAYDLISCPAQNRGTLSGYSLEPPWPSTPSP